MPQLLCGIDHCHSHHIIHRNINASNLLSDNRGILKIADFGLASFFDPEQMSVHRLDHQKEDSHFVDG
jgi:serine/threonine protein kinase